MIAITLLLLTFNIAMDLEEGSKGLKEASDTIKEIKVELKLSGPPEMSRLLDKEPAQPLSYEQRQLEIQLQHKRRRELKTST